MTNDIVIALSLLKGIGPVFIRTIDFEVYQESNNKYIIIEEILNRKKKFFPKEEIYTAIDKAESIIIASEKLGLEIINITEEVYPKSLLDLKDCPPFLFLRGNKELLSKDIIAIVGTRKPDSIGAKIATKLGEYFGERKLIVCNGLADGIDAFSIQDSKAKVLSSIGVLGGGLDICDSKTVKQSTQLLAERVLENNGLLISENFASKKEDPYSLIKACRIQAGISKGVILVQSDIGGGSRFTLKTAIETGRQIGIVVPPQKYYSSSFEANFKIFREKEQGLLMFCEASDKFRSIIKLIFIESSSDYEKMISSTFE